LKPSLYGVKFGRVGRKAQEAYIFGTDDLSRAMAWSAVEHDEQMVVGVGFRESVEETLQASCVHLPGQVKAEALSRCGLERRIEVGPLVGAPDDVGRAKAFGAVALPMPVDEAETGFVEGQDLQRFVGFSAVALGA
jgi:hypothetical protein